MKKFQFTLRSVETVRSIRELRAREIFSASVLAHAAAVAALDDARSRRSKLERLMSDERQGLFKAAEQVSFFVEQQRLKQAEDIADQALGRAIADMNKCRDLWIASRRDVRVIEKLELKARNRHRQDCDREEQAAMDDRAGAAVARAPLILS